jgi:hypothetical protein
MHKKLFQKKRRDSTFLLNVLFLQQKMTNIAQIVVCITIVISPSPAPGYVGHHLLSVHNTIGFDTHNASTTHLQTQLRTLLTKKKEIGVTYFFFCKQ